jgi:hypothetical protein
MYSHLTVVLFSYLKRIVLRDWQMSYRLLLFFFYSEDLRDVRLLDRLDQLAKGIVLMNNIVRSLSCLVVLEEIIRLNETYLENVLYGFAFAGNMQHYVHKEWVHVLQSFLDRTLKSNMGLPISKLC